MLGVLLLLLIPLLPGFLELYQKTDIAALGINRLHTGNANIFAVNYRRHLSALEQKGQGTDWVARFARLQAQQRPVITEEVRAQGYLRIPAGFHCLTEVYCNGDISTGMGVILQCPGRRQSEPRGEQHDIALGWRAAYPWHPVAACLAAWWQTSRCSSTALSVFSAFRHALILLGCGWDRNRRPLLPWRWTSTICPTPCFITQPCDVPLSPETSPCRRTACCGAIWWCAGNCSLAMAAA
jgi:hypothetical protein